ncbi:hypothetical protein GCM10011506_05080 [Marivirga lumbricoides]|uniref:Uncharacterized protein n=1 Tax=Marivirga lumbricoides TaxID=1046115 RepID=A0ABQ1LCE4_9BACT|nr:hypothetical protein GCM10011506_05080 [Marivirga lumbricoides]
MKNTQGWVYVLAKKRGEEEKCSEHSIAQGLNLGLWNVHNIPDTTNDYLRLLSPYN